MLESPAYNGGDPVGCHNYLVMRVQTQECREGGEPQQGLVVFPVMHKLAKFLVIFNHTVFPRK